MSQVKIQGNPSGTGTFTIAAPNSNTDRTLTLPDATGTVTVAPAGAVNFTAAPSGALTVDASGNAGLGVTPSAWGGTGNPALQIGGSNTSNIAGNAHTFYMNNVYFDGTTYRYINSSVNAHRYRQIFNGGHAWDTAPSGTAGAAISFTQAMTLGSDSRLLLNATSNPNTARLYVADFGGYLANLHQAATGGAGSDLLFSHAGDSNKASVALTGDTNGSALAFYTGTGPTERARITSDGNLQVGAAVGTTSRIVAVRNNPTAYDSAQVELHSTAGDVILGFHAAGSTAACIDHLRGNSGVRVTNSNRSAFAPIAASAFNVNSDYRIKENVQPLTGASERLMQIPVHRFAFAEGSMMYRDGAVVDGFIAHEVQPVVPEAVTGEKDAVDGEGNAVMQQLDQSKLVPLLTAALQEALTKITALEARIVALEGN